MVTISSGPATVISHGTTTAFFGYPLLWELLLDDQPFTVSMTFATDEGALRVESDPSAWGIAFTLFNFDNSQGRGSSRPVLLGELGGQVYFLHFRCFRYGQTDDHTVHYTFYRLPSGSPILALEPSAQPG